MLHCAIWYHLSNLRNVKKLMEECYFQQSCRFLACNNFTKSKTPPWVFFTFFKSYKSYQIAQSMTYKSQKNKQRKQTNKNKNNNNTAAWIVVHEINCLTFLGELHNKQIAKQKRYSILSTMTSIKTKCI